MFIEFFLDMMLFIGLISLFNVLRYVFKIRKIIKVNKDNPNIQGITIVNGEVKIIEKTPTVETHTEVVQETVKDPICETTLEKDKAYRVIRDEAEYFFCSWECREAFLNKKKQEEGCE